MVRCMFSDLLLTLDKCVCIYVLIRGRAVSRGRGIGLAVGCVAMAVR